MFTWFGRIFTALLILAALPFHGIVPVVWISSFFDEYLYSLVSGADPKLLAYLDSGPGPIFLLLFSTIALIGALLGVLRGRRYAARLIMLAAIADALSLYLANKFGLTRIDLSALEITLLGAFMVVLWLIVRGVTKED
ncbi:hypothetical protein HK107_15280 [Parvularcula sp. ZS-1/3]|uniref:Uncharacterized protein n=1 Tax=Parvularcula mediterranea TaxID=2732508 RepID=A0A7Y3W6M3_9PROT|nr:hypothetical protein [Parvularcula mediterranea]NNU17693.1 hypothetical protein [Parvularcula mediterranea]